MRRVGITKLRALGITAVIAMIVVAFNTGPTETRRNNESVDHMADAPTDADSSTVGQSSTSDGSRDVSGDSAGATGSAGDPGRTAGSAGDPGRAAGSPGDPGRAAGSPGDPGRTAGSPGDVGPAARSDPPDRAASPAPTSSPTTSEKVGARADGGTTTTTPTTAAKRWVQVARMSGRADQRTAPFRLRGGEVRLRYDFDGDGLFLVSVAEPKPAGEHNEDIYYADRHCSAPCQGTQPLDKQAGEYYVEVQSSGGPWSVVVEEYR